MYRYIPLLRPASTATLPRGVTWAYVEVPREIAPHRLDLPASAHRYGVIQIDRSLTQEECAHFALSRAPSKEGYLSEEDRKPVQPTFTPGERPIWIVELVHNERGGKERRDTKYVRATDRDRAERCARHWSSLPAAASAYARLATPQDLGCVPTPRAKEGA